MIPNDCTITNFPHTCTCNYALAKCARHNFCENTTFIPEVISVIIKSANSESFFCDQSNITFKAVPITDPFCGSSTMFCFESHEKIQTLDWTTGLEHWNGLWTNIFWIFMHFCLVNWFYRLKYPQGICSNEICTGISYNTSSIPSISK